MPVSGITATAGIKISSFLFILIWVYDLNIKFTQLNITTEPGIDTAFFVKTKKRFAKKKNISACFIFHTFLS